MEAQEDKNKQTGAKEQIGVLEHEMMSAFKEGKNDAVRTTFDKIIKLDPDNRLAQKLMEKTEKARKKEEEKTKVQKVKEYVMMLKKLHKQKDVEKLTELAKEFKDFAPYNKHADKWILRAEKLQEKLGGKKADMPLDDKAELGEATKDGTGVKVEGKEIKIEAKKDIPPDDKAQTGKEKKPGFFAKLFKKSKKPAKSDEKQGLMQMMAKKAKVEPVKIEAKKEEPAKVETKAEPAKPAFGIPAKPLETKPVPAPEAPALKTIQPAPLKPIAPSVAPAKPVAPTPLKTPAPPAATDKPLAPTPLAPVATPAAEPAKKVPAKEVDKPKEAKGNIFTRMFGKKEDETKGKSIIDTIVAKTDKKKVETKEAEPKKSDKKKDATALLTFSKVFMNFTIIFVFLSATFIYVEWIDKENVMLSLVGISQNTGGRLHSATEDANALVKQEETLSKDIELYKGGYEDKAIATVEKIIDERINWPDIFSKINEVTNSVYELNEFFKYIEYNNYSFDAEKGTIRVSGSLTDPLGRNLTKLVELEEAFKFYPKDRNNPDDMTRPYFIGFKEFTSFSKTLDSATGRYNSSFQLSFVLNE